MISKTTPLLGGKKTTCLFLIAANAVLTACGGGATSAGNKTPSQPVVVINTPQEPTAPTTAVLRESGFGTDDLASVVVISRSVGFAPKLADLPVIDVDEANTTSTNVLELERTLFEGAQYVRSFVGSGEEKFAVISGSVPLSGSATYEGEAAIRIADATAEVAFDDADGSARIDVNFASNSRVGTFSVTNGTQTDNLGQSTDFTGGSLVIDMAQSGRSEITLTGFGDVAFDGDRIFARTAFGGPEATEIAGVVWGKDDDTEVNLSFVGAKQ